MQFFPTDLLKSCDFERYVPNKLTKDYIKESKKLEYIFKVILGSFNKKRKKPIGVFTENTVTLFNNFVSDISNYIKLSEWIKINSLVNYNITPKDPKSIQKFIECNDRYSFDCNFKILNLIINNKMNSLQTV